MFQFHAKYKNKSFQEISGLVQNDKKIMQTLIRSLNHPSTSQDKKNEIQQFIDFYNQPILQEHEPENNRTNMTELTIDIPKIERIFHISDIHIRLYNRQNEYQNVFQKLYDYIKQNTSNKEIIIITGDLLHSKNNLSPESILITQHFLINLAAICPTFLIAGNHDAMLTNQQREDSITAIVQNIRIPNFFYLRNSGVYLATNVAIAVCSILDNQWIHNDPVSAASGPYGVPIAHGFLILSLITGLECQSYSIKDVKIRINYGLNHLRFITPLKVDSDIYLTTKLISVEDVNSGTKMLKQNTVICPTESRPILTVERITLVKLDD
jgi:acyl dehydratase